MSCEAARWGREGVPSGKGQGEGGRGEGSIVDWLIGNGSFGICNVASMREAMVCSV